MPFSVTVKLEPISHPSGKSKLREVIGVRLGLRGFGPGLSKAEVGSPKPAALVLHSGFLKKARNVSSAELKPLARLEGTVSFEGTPPRPLFVFPEKVELVYVGQVPPEDKPARQLALEFEGAHFREAPGLDQDAARLRLPDAGEGDRFLELGVELLVEGEAEARLEANDRLDAPLRPLRVGLVLEFPASLGELVPPSLTLEAKQGGLTRQLRWAQGIVDNGFRRFLFREILGAAPVDLSAILGARRELLWEQQIINDPTRPPTWRLTLEDFVRPNLTAGTELVPKEKLVGERNDLPQPKIVLPGVDDKVEESFLVGSFLQ
jgi:hypothetical protein